MTTTSSLPAGRCNTATGNTDSSLRMKLLTKQRAGTVAADEAHSHAHTVNEVRAYRWI